MSKSHFDEMCLMNTDLKRKLFNNMCIYQDRYKMWQKSQLKNISYFKKLSFESLEQITYKIQLEYLEEGQLLFKSGQVLDKLYILAEGSIETFVTINEEDETLDILRVPGCNVGANSILTDANMDFSARVGQDGTKVLTLNYDDLRTLEKTLPDLSEAIE